MECNKDEAERAKEIAERKFNMKDIAGAKKFALKAQSLYPDVEGVSQMLATFDVYIAAETKTNGEVNWYEVLNANPQDDNETLKRKYRKLCLTLHPDKNKSVGAEGAFKHVSEAWKFLSDKEKRAAYDRRRSLQTVYQKVSVSASNNGFCNFAKTTSFPTNPRTTTTQKNYPPKKPVGVSTQKAAGRSDHHKTTKPSAFEAPEQSKSKSNTFWTICRRCMMQYEYLRIYVNCNLRCANCGQSFSATEVPKPGVSSYLSSSSRFKRNLDPKVGFNHSQWTFSRTSSAAHAASVVQQAYEKVKKEREEAKASGRREKKNAKRKTTSGSVCGTSLKKRRVIGETEVACFGGRKVTYCVTGESGKRLVKK